MTEIVNRRKYVKYASAGVITSAVAVSGYFYQEKHKPLSPTAFISLPPATYSTTKREKEPLTITVTSLPYLKKTKNRWITFHLHFQLADSTHIPVDKGSIEISGHKVLTDTKGEASIKNIHPGIHSIKVEKDGYEPKLVTIEVAFPEVKPHFETLNHLDIHHNQSKIFIAAYYGWYSLDEHGWRHWDDPHNPITTYHPLLGQFTGNALSQSYGLYGFSRDYRQNISLILQQMCLARLTGISAFAVSWWGPNSFENTYMPMIIEAAKKTGVKITIIFEPFYETEDDKETTILQAINYLRENYIDSEVWLRDSENQPVIFTFNIGPYDNWSRWNDYITDTDIAWVAHTTDRRVLEYGFKYFYEYSPAKILLTGNTIRDIYLLVSNGKPFKSQFIPTLSPRYNDSSIHTPATIIGEDLWEKSKEATHATIHQRNPPFIFVTSWNEWHESTSIEPTTQDGFKFINTFIHEFTDRELSEEQILHILGISEGLHIPQHFKK